MPQDTFIPVVIGSGWITPSPAQHAALTHAYVWCSPGPAPGSTDPW
jgi:hypothetical protein